MRILELLLLGAVSVISLLILWVHRHIFQLNMISIKVLNKSDVIALLLLTRRLKNI